MYYLILLLLPLHSLADPPRLSTLIDLLPNLNLGHSARLSSEENSLLQTTCGQTDSIMSRSNGPRINQSDAPFTVALGSGPTKIFCSGTFISKSHVLTAAHCIIGLRREPLYVMVTKNIPEEESKLQYVVLDQLRVRKIHYPRMMDIKTVGDIALLEVDSSKQLPSQPVCLPNADVPVDNEVRLYGYGRNIHDETVYHPLGVLRTVTSKTEFCPLFGPFEICFNGYPLLACGGDSGGSLISTISDRITLTGVLTRGNHYCHPGLPMPSKEEYAYLDMGTNVYYHLDWICHASGICPTEETEKNVMKYEPYVQIKYQTIVV